MNPLPATFDYIIIGAGSAGCVLANRLSADPKINVLLLEAGGKDRSPLIHIPVGFSKLLNNERLNWCFETEPEKGTGERAIPIPRGKVLGGSSSINGMLYVRGQALDYDIWAQLGNCGWSYQEVLPYFKRSENFIRGGSALRGTGGELNVANMIEQHPLLDAFVDAGEELGFPRNLDYNGEDQEGFGYYQVTQKSGRRHSSAAAFLHPVSHRTNLQIITHAHTKRIVFKQRRAIGVTYDIQGNAFEARAAREVILCAGAVQSPQLLELSGIGDPTLLSSYGIEVIHPLPGVGENYQDHYAAWVNWRIKSITTLNEQSRGPRLAWEALKYGIARRGVLTYTAGIAHGFVKTHSTLETPDVQFHFAHASYKSSKDRKLDTEPGMTLSVCQLRPESVGSIHIKTDNPFAAPAIRPNFLSASTDREVLIEGLRIARRVGEAPAFDPYREFEMNPGEDCQSDADWLSYARASGAHNRHE